MKPWVLWRTGSEFFTWIRSPGLTAVTWATNRHLWLSRITSPPPFLPHDALEHHDAIPHAVVRAEHERLGRLRLAADVPVLVDRNRFVRGRRADELQGPGHGAAVRHGDDLVRRARGRRGERLRRQEDERYDSGLTAYSRASQKLRLYRKNHRGNTTTTGSHRASCAAVESSVNAQSRT